MNGTPPTPPIHIQYGKEQALKRLDLSYSTPGEIAGIINLEAAIEQATKKNDRIRLQLLQIEKARREQLGNNLPSRAQVYDSFVQEAYQPVKPDIQLEKDLRELLCEPGPYKPLDGFAPVAFTPVVVNAPQNKRFHILKIGLILIILGGLAAGITFVIKKR